jgi:transcription initiation factor TFIIIB Brf1 subunit/transcription initiation factor TFIIB
MTTGRKRDENTMKLVKRRPRPELPHWYKNVRWRTSLEPSDADRIPDRDFWKELKYINEDNDRRNRTEEDKLKVANAVSSQLRLGESVKEEVERIAKLIDGRRFNHLGGLEALVIGVVAFAVNRNRERLMGDEFAFEDRMGADKQFRDMAERLGVDRVEATQEVRKVMRERENPTVATGTDAENTGSPLQSMDVGHSFPTGTAP